MAQRKHHSLSQLTGKPITIPAFTAVLEHLFSNWSYVHSLIILSPEKSKKLLYIYHSLKVLDRPTDEY